MNIVTESKNQTPAKTIAQCMEPDGITKNLWTWAERLETYGKILFWLISIFGIILSIEAGASAPTDKFSYELFFVSLIETAFVSFIEYCTYHVLALLISSLASIVHNNKATARLLQLFAENQCQKDQPEPNSKDR